MKLKGLIIFSVLAIVACNKGDDKQKAVTEAEQLYQTARDNFDANTARVALSQLIILQPDSSKYRDSLCRLYIRSNNFEGGVKLGKNLISENKADNTLKELIGVAYQQTGDMNEAIDVFDGLFKETKDYRYAYQVAAIQYELGNPAVFDSISNNLLELSMSDSLVARTLIDFPGPLSGAAQLIPMQAATLFLKGKFAFDKTQDLKTAIAYYQQAIEAFENFEMPYYYLQEIEMQQRGLR